MEKAPLRFEDQSSADFILCLTGPNKEKYERNPVYLHSAILKRAKFFEIKLSERCSSGKLTEVSVTTPHRFDDYLKCIQLMYSERVYFSNVEECLSILCIASGLLADESINKCMQYLEAVRWSGEEESQIRNVVSSLNLKVLPDLAARLESVCNIVFLRLTLFKQMVSILQGVGDTGINKERAEKYIASIFDKNHRDVVKACGHELLQGFISSVRSRNFSALRLLSKWIDRCDGEIVEKAFKAFCEDKEFIKYVEEYGNRIDGMEVVFSTILWFMTGIGDRKIIVSRVYRSSFITTSLPIMTKLCCGNLQKLDKVENAILILLESLPNVDKIRICNSWIEIYRRNLLDIAKPLTVLTVLEDAHCKCTLEQK